MLELDVIHTSETALVALDPIRSRLLAELAQPASAAALATRIGLPRQKINYHLHTLETHGLIRVAEERKWGGLTERLMVASATSYVISPDTLGPVAADPARAENRLSARYLLALASRAVQEVGRLLRLSEAAQKPLATLSIDTEIRFKSAADRAAFSHELTQAMLTLAAKYHAPHAPEGRSHRVVVLAHPLPNPQPSKEPSCPS